MLQFFSACLSLKINKIQVKSSPYFPNNLSKLGFKIFTSFWSTWIFCFYCHSVLQVSSVFSIAVSQILLCISTLAHLPFCHLLVREALSWCTKYRNCSRFSWVWSMIPWHLSSCTLRGVRGMTFTCLVHVIAQKIFLDLY